MATRLFRSRNRTPSLSSLPDDTVHLSGHKRLIRRVVPLPDGERIITAGRDNTLRLFSVRSGKCLMTYKGHTKYVKDVALLSDDTMVSVSEDKTARLWHVSDATLIHTVTFDSEAWSVASLGAGRFVAGLFSGDQCELQLSDNTAPILVKTVRSAQGSHSEVIRDISVCGGRFATASSDKTTKVWDSVTLQCLATLSGHSDWVRSVALSDTFVATGSDDNTIRVYDANTFEVLRNIATHSDSVYSVRLVGQENIVSSSRDGTVAIHKTSTGEPVWRIDVGSRARDSIILSTGHIATALYSGTAIVYNPPENIVSQISQSSNVGLPLSTAFQLALSTCLSGDSSPLDHCNKITYSSCSASLEEWHSAHQILILAVNNKDIPQSTEHNGEISWWFEQLYLAIKDIDITSNEDLKAVKRCLREAKAFGLIESIDSVLGALHVAKAFEQEIRALHRAGILIFQRVLQLEGQVERFVKSFERYRKQQRYSQLIGIALQLIPIAGGAAAGALTAGAEIAESLSIKDVADYAFGLVSNVTQEEVSSFGDRALRRAADVLSPEQLREMDVVRRRRLEQAVEGCGLRVEEVREMFLEKVSGKVEVTSVPIEEKRLDATDGDIDTVSTSSTEPDTGEAAEVEQVAGDLTAQAEGCYLLLNWESCKPSDFKDFAIENEKIKELQQRQLATVWAAFAVRHDDTRYEEFQHLGECLRVALEVNDIFGDELVETEGPRIDVVTEIALGSVRNDDRITLTFGLEGRIGKFLSKIGARS